VFEKGDIMETIRNVDVNRLHDFKNHPFKVEMNTELCELMRSIEKEGVLVPLLVRTNPYGDGYEVISGHRRKEAAIWAGETKVPVVIRELDDDQAVVAMVDSNLHRENLKPSEKAFAYKMKLDAMKHQGKHLDSGALAQVGPKFTDGSQLNEKGNNTSTINSNELLARQVGESVAQIKRYIRLTKLAYKGYLMEFFKPKTVNLRIQAINKYLEYLEEQQLQLKAVKVQQKNFLENVISNADYNFLKKQLKKDSNMEWYFVVWYLAATGARVSELIQIKIEHIEIGYFDLYTKGGKLRRLYIPQKLKKETLEWLKEKHRSSGYLFLNRYGERITTRGISQQLKNYAEKYGLDKKVVYPHSFRHRYAKNFLEKYNDIALLADLMGHESIETTRIYLRRTASEQQELVDKIVTW